MLKTSDLKLKFLGIVPTLIDQSGSLTPEQIVSLSALLTFKGKSVKRLLQETFEKKQDLDKKVMTILCKSSLRGHASIATTPVLAFTYEASKFLDSMLTGIIFSSSLMASGRRTDTVCDDVVFPTSILKNKKTKELYKKTSDENINFYNYLLKQGIRKDEVSRILHYGIYGTGIISLSVESVISFLREYEAEKDWMPEEAGLLRQEIEKSLKKLGIDWLYKTRQLAPRNVYPYPNIFKNPKVTSQVRELRGQLGARETKVVGFSHNVTTGLKKRMRALEEKTKKLSQLKNLGFNKWYKLLLERRQITRDYAASLNFKVLSSVCWRVWGEKKRHRTVPQVVESVYYCAERAFKKLKRQKAKGKITIQNLKLIDLVFSIPPTIRSKKEWLEGWLKRAYESLKTYDQLVKMGIRPADAIFIVPRALRLDVLQDYNFYNLFTGYYPLRLCTTAEEQMHALTVREVEEMKKILKKQRLSWLASHLVPKCYLTGFCPEEKFCGKIKLFNKNYNDKIHQKMLRILDKKFKDNLQVK